MGPSGRPGTPTPWIPAAAAAATLAATAAACAAAAWAADEFDELGLLELLRPISGGRRAGFFFSGSPGKRKFECYSNGTYYTYNFQYRFVPKLLSSRTRLCGSDEHELLGVIFAAI